MTDTTKPSTHEDYFATLNHDMRAALVELAARIDARLPGYEHCVSYAMPAWRPKGAKGSKQIVVGVAGFTRQLGIYPYSGSIVPRIAARVEAAGFRTTKSGINFTPDNPLPDWVLDEIIALRRAEIG
ncbi:iron chaperone [uncultured Maritimibacter sp.]|jgi:uncharacterized protein YdhG (YjbR/CyaY superfamily)|uniref:iron chaperone n=1 Tax=uncultured Maritimibacter sp. TaxID=991866 RepID=UPI000B1453F5|nr:DUF1801 domain-containing protein [uncultured Maritimibacter sp.]